MPDIIWGALIKYTDKTKNIYRLLFLLRTYLVQINLRIVGLKVQSLISV